MVVSYPAVAKDCGSLAVPMNGSAIGRKTIYPNEITFGCDDGFNMAGSRIRKCQSTGIWSGNQTSCTGNLYPFVYCIPFRSLISFFMLFSCPPLLFFFLSVDSFSIKASTKAYLLKLAVKNIC